ncbi:DEAD/DEAH box RNA helicase [Achlya hypogyna]|uniref:DEAD/DEAH box RNA helicase n=1 Tax=Achlya hypogyna TaxID=1202772 RepID=A0A1V9ZGW0_ACHHY|nr:DEAD/DEAH box RNA helicase [Achlya hypogyna]
MAAPHDDALMMTIMSDDEIEVLDSSSDEEEAKEQELAVISKSQKKKLQSKKEQMKKKAGESEINESFQFDDGARLAARGTLPVRDEALVAIVKLISVCVEAIAHIDDMERRVYGESIRSTVQKKIEVRRKERLAERREKRKEARAKNDEADGEEADDDDEPTSAPKEVMQKDPEDSEDEDSEDEDVVEEERLQAALKERKAQAAEAVDEIEKKKAAAFYDDNDDIFRQTSPADLKTFSDLKLSRALVRAVTSLGYEKPTPIQQRAIPIALSGKDICASAQTGSGKTAAFLLPILERLQFRSRKVAATRVLIICPVRELATQCQSVLEQLGKFTDVTSALAVGGLPLREQEIELRKLPDVVICTPGRMIDHLRNSKSVHMDDLEILVLDEADRLLELGFTEEVQELVGMCPVARQTMLFSATLTSKVDELIKLSMKRPVRISTDPLYDMAQNLVQEFVRIRPTREEDREAILLALCTRTFKTNTIVFMETKKHAHRMMILFGLAGIKAAELHGDLDQRERLQALQNFRDGTADILLCTDIAARGIDVEGVHAVINYQMPKDVTTYVHRVGRTARAGRKGRAVTLTSESRRLIMKEVARHCHGFVKSRSVPDAVINQWRARIESMEEDVSAVMKEETLEKRMREAEREASRTTNLIRHQSEISARPARTWFQNEKEKKVVANRAEEARQAKLAEMEAAEDKKKHPLNHKKRRMTEIREREQALLEDAAEQNKKVFTSQHVAGAAKSAKRKAIEEKREIANRSISEIHELKRQKREKMQAQRAAKGGFDEDMSRAKKAAPKERPETGARGAKKDEFVFKERITNLRKQGKRSVNSFKSKARYNRRK